jgi:hypothetical protein
MARLPSWGSLQGKFNQPEWRFDSIQGIKKPLSFLKGLI